MLRTGLTQSQRFKVLSPRQQLLPAGSPLRSDFQTSAEHISQLFTASLPTPTTPPYPVSMATSDLPEDEICPTALGGNTGPWAHATLGNPTSCFTSVHSRAHQQNPSQGTGMLPGTPREVLRLGQKPTDHCSLLHLLSHKIS